MKKNIILALMTLLGISEVSPYSDAVAARKVRHSVKAKKARKPRKARRVSKRSKARLARLNKAKAQSKDLSADQNAPVAEVNKPAQNNAVAEVNKPAADAPKPAADALQPAADAPKPAADTPKPAAEPAVAAAQQRNVEAERLVAMDLIRDGVKAQKKALGYEVFPAADTMTKLFNLAKYASIPAGGDVPHGLAVLTNDMLLKLPEFQTVMATLMVQNQGDAAAAQKYHTLLWNLMVFLKHAVSKNVTLQSGNNPAEIMNYQVANADAIIPLADRHKLQINGNVPGAAAVAAPLKSIDSKAVLERMEKIASLPYGVQYDANLSFMAPANIPAAPSADDFANMAFTKEYTDAIASHCKEDFSAFQRTLDTFVSEAKKASFAQQERIKAKFSIAEQSFKKMRDEKDGIQTLNTKALNGEIVADVLQSASTGKVVQKDFA